MVSGEGEVEGEGEGEVEGEGEWLGYGAQALVLVDDRQADWRVG